MSSKNLLHVENMVKTYPPRKKTGEPLLVVDNVSMDVGTREFVVIIGASGCGKSTVLSAIAGLTPFDSGVATINGEQIDGPSDTSAMVFQHANLLPWKTVQQNVEFGLTLRRTMRREQIRSKAAEMINLVGLTGFETHYPHEISGGMQQRVNLARALAVEPALILMDEPFGALDALTKENMQDELTRVMGEVDRSVVFITHDIREAVYLADKVLVMSARPGRIIKEIKVPFERPRSRDITETPQFEQISHELRELLNHERAAAREVA